VEVVVVLVVVVLQVASQLEVTKRAHGCLQ
jgi:hypothetical protein